MGELMSQRNTEQNTLDTDELLRELKNDSERKFVRANIVQCLGRIAKNIDEKQETVLAEIDKGFDDNIHRSVMSASVKASTMIIQSALNKEIRHLVDEICGKEK